MTNQEKLDAFAAAITKFINSGNTSNRRVWRMSGIERMYMLLSDEFTGSDLDDLHTIALNAIPQLDDEFAARLTAINER